jgi:hypothetical protein
MFTHRRVGGIAALSPLTVGLGSRRYLPSYCRSCGRSAPDNGLWPTRFPQPPEASGQPTTLTRRRRPVGEDLVTQTDTLIADGCTRPRNQPPYVVFRPSAEGASVAASPVTTVHRATLSRPRLPGIRSELASAHDRTRSRLLCPARLSTADDSHQPAHATRSPAARPGGSRSAARGARALARRRVATEWNLRPRRRGAMPRERLR